MRERTTLLYTQVTAHRRRNRGVGLLKTFLLEGLVFVHFYFVYIFTPRLGNVDIMRTIMLLAQLFKFGSFCTLQRAPCTDVRGVTLVLMKVAKFAQRYTTPLI